MSAIRGPQWEVTEYGMRSVRPAAGYEIHAEDLCDMRHGRRSILAWPAHMAEKRWVDLDQFIETFCSALRVHHRRLCHAVDERLLKASIDAAWDVRGGRATRTPVPANWSLAHHNAG